MALALHAETSNASRVRIEAGKCASTSATQYAICVPQQRPSQSLRSQYGHTRGPTRHSTHMMASSGASFNPFRNRKKEDAAKKALQEMFEGKKDLLADYDSGGGGSGKGGKGKGRGGGGDDGEAFNWREWSSKFFADLGRGTKSVLQAAAAIVLLITIFSASHLIKPASEAAYNGMRWLLRLDGRGSRRAQTVVAKPTQGAALLGDHERSIIGKYGAEEDVEALAEPQHNEEEDEE